MASFVYPPLTPEPDPAPLSPTIPLNPPMVGEASPFDHVDGQNRDLILESIRSWVRHELRGWTTAWQEYLVYWLALVSGYLNDFVEAADDYISEHAISGYSWRTTNTAIATTGTTVVTITGVDTEHRPLIIGDLVSDHSQDIHYGVIVGVVDASHATVQYIGNLRGLVGFGWWPTTTDITHSGTTAVVLTAVADRIPQVGDFVVDDTASVAYGRITVVTDATHVTVAYIGTMQGPVGPQGPQGDPGVVQAIVAGSNVVVDDTDPANPIVSASGSGFGVVEAVVAGSNVTVDDTDPANPIVSATNGGGVVEAVVAGDNVTVDDTDPANPIVSAGSPGSALVESVVGGTNVTVDSTDPANPIVSATGGGGSGIVESVVAGTNVTVNDTDPANPIVSATGGSGIVESVVAGDRITVDDTDPANPVVSTANGIPLNVFPTVDRPAALVDGDAYFDSDLIIPVWSYGGEWRDSDSNVIPDVPEPDDVDNDGGSGPTVTGYRLSPGFGGANQFNNYSYVEFEGALYSGPTHDIPINPGSDEQILLRFNGSTVTPVERPGFITLRDYIRTSGIWVISGVMYLLVTTLDTTTGDATTYYMSFDGTDFTDLSAGLSTELSESYVFEAWLATDGSLYYRGETPTGGSQKVFWADDLATPPVQAVGDSVTSLSVFHTYAVGNGAVSYNPTQEDVERIVNGVFSSSYGATEVVQNSFLSTDVEGRGQAVLTQFNTDPPRIYTAVADGINSTGVVITTHGLGFTATGRVWVSDPADISGDHVAFNLVFAGVTQGGASGVYLDGHAYVEVYDGSNAYLARIAVSV